MDEWRDVRMCACAPCASSNPTANPPPGAVLSLDFDRVKLVNDTLGHAVGDGSLCEAADRLHSLMITHPGSMAARFGGDEFGRDGARHRLGRAAASLHPAHWRWTTSAPARHRWAASMGRATCQPAGAR
ncbi:MAG: diguanylate cyclase domain-containing protein [Rubrivivax sp.]